MSDNKITQENKSTQKTKSTQEDKMLEDADNRSQKADSAVMNTTFLSKKVHTKRSIWNMIILSLCILGFFCFGALLLKDILLPSFQSKKSAQLTRELYETSIVNKPSLAPVASITVIPNPDSNRDSQGRLLQFKELLTECIDVKGWLTIPNTNIDYVVTQGRTDDPNYYLDKDIYGNYSKAGTLYLDIRGSIEDNSQNLVIHGHNMISTEEKMFHYLLNYKKTSYYKEHPIITFDTIYSTGQWKVFAVFISNGSDDKEPLFDYRTATFKDSSEFLNFIYQIRVRSILNTDVDINEEDQILCLSTCSYEVENYRTVVVARKVRQGEAPTVDVEYVELNPSPLYPSSYYYRYGGKAPKLYETFEDALEHGEITWYNN
jgi:sortase B